ncbi:MAG: Flp pilus assembly complex ATPase component TadA [Kiritimatiellae bacterium]|nr:Flp pilus assembly complex ATPase component TadA [Kiritimatiellia bacterium]
MSPPRATRIDFGRFLIDRKIIREDQLRLAIKGTRAPELTPDVIRDLLLDKGVINEEDAARALAEFYGLPYVDLRHTVFDPLAIEKVNVDFSQKNTLIPFLLSSKEISVAFKSYDFSVVDQLKQMTNCEVLVHLASKSRIAESIELQYAAHMTEAAAAHLDLSRIVEASEQSEPVQQFSDALILDAIKERASDIHIEPQDKFIRVRYRIDGVLEERLKLDLRLLPAIISRYKVMASLDIAESRRPQDGRIRYAIGTREFDLRMSCLPTTVGEKIVLRILDKSGVNLNLDNMYLSKSNYKRMMRVISSSNGIFFVTGPTGSGKTTTCYAALNYLNTIEKNIVTIEDPVEYRLPIVNQIQVHHEIGLDFPKALRSVLRQDPDIVLVGEIRDLETARIAAQAALTGHLVLSTLHTNNAVEAVLRLVDIGVEPFLVAPTVIGVLGQRLVRKVCRHCRRPYEPSPQEQAYFRIESSATEFHLFRGAGCPACRRSGYMGRVALHELCVVTNAIRELIMENAPMSEIEKAATKSGYRNMRFDGLKKAILGLTTLQEVLRMTTTQEDYFMD